MLSLVLMQTRMSDPVQYRRALLILGCLKQLSVIIQYIQQNRCKSPTTRTYQEYQLMESGLLLAWRSLVAAILRLMAATRLAEDQWNDTVRPALRATLNAASMAKTFPHKVLYGLDLYQGLAIHHSYFLQEIMHIMTHIQESMCKSQTGGLLRLSAEAFRVELGVLFTLGSTSSFCHGYYITDCWHKTLWNFIEAHSMEIVEDYPSLHTLREGDKFLMK